MVEPGDDDTTDEFRWLVDEYDFVYKLTRSSEQLAETVFRAFFAHGPVDPEGRKRYQVLHTSAKFPGRLPERPEGQSIYNQHDPSFWYSDSERGISCVFEFRHSLVRWTGPMVRPAASADEHDKEDNIEVWEIDPQFKVEYRLEGIKLRHETLLDFLRDTGLLPAEPLAPEPTAEPSSPPLEQSQSDSTEAEQSSPSERSVSREEPQAEETSQENLEPKWDPLADWSVETVFRELKISGPAMKTIVMALPELPALPNRLRRYRGKSVVEILDNISAAELFEAIGKLGSPDSCEKFKRAWKEYRAKQGIFIR